MTENEWITRIVFAILGVAVGLSATGNPTIPALLVLALAAMLYRDRPESTKRSKLSAADVRHEN